MAAAFVRALVTVLLMGRVAVLYRYRAVPVARLPSCSLRPRAAARPLAVRAASLRLGASARSPARPCRRPRAPQLPACRRGALPPPSSITVARMSKGCPAAALGHHSCPHVEGVPCHPPSGTAAARISKGRPATRPRVPQPPACRRSALPPAPASFPPLRPCWQSVWLCTYKIAGTKRSRRFTVGVAGFEPTASSSRTKRATKLRHTPVPNEYSHTSSENPNRDQRTMGSVCHAAKMSVR